GTSRFSRRPATGPTSVALPDPIVGATFALTGNDVSATWTSAPAGDVSMEVFANTSDFATLWFYDLEATEDYAGAATTMSFDLADVPIPADLLFDFATIQHDRTVTVLAGADPTIDGASATVTVNAPPGLRKRDARIAAKRLHR